jgi:hypothetical protein
MSKRIFGPKNWPNLKNSLEVSHYTHLLIELRRLSEASLFIEVAEIKDIRSSFR